MNWEKNDCSRKKEREKKKIITYYHSSSPTFKTKTKFVWTKTYGTSSEKRERERMGNRGVNVTRDYAEQLNFSDSPFAH